jgi:hypothetical protein
MSGGSGALLTFDRLRGVLDLPWTRRIPEGSLDRGLSG